MVKLQGFWRGNCGDDMEVNSIYLNYYTVLTNFMEENILEVYKLYEQWIFLLFCGGSVLVLFDGIFFILILIKWNRSMKPSSFYYSSSRSVVCGGFVLVLSLLESSLFWFQNETRSNKFHGKRGHSFELEGEENLVCTPECSWAAGDKGFSSDSPNPSMLQGESQRR